MTIASTGAVALLRAWRATARAAKKLAAATGETVRRDGPRVRAALAGFASEAVGRLKVAPRRWQAAGLVLFVACSLLAIYAYRGRSSRVDIVVDGAVEGGTIEVREGDTLLLREELDGPGHSSFRLPPGRHELALAFVAPGRLNLGKAIDVEVEPRTAYELQVSVSTWPWKRIGTDWDRVSD